MSERTWDDFLAFLYEMPSRLRPGRQQIRVVRDRLQDLVDERVLPALTEEESSTVFPLGFSPAESDLKLAAGIGIERGLITVQEYETALRADKAAGPFGFLQDRSGKTFGETVAPEIARFWLEAAGDSFTKMPNTALYDFGWRPSEGNSTIRIELKASSEVKARFQQVRHPWMTDQAAEEPEYDILLCLKVSNEGLEWWIFTARDVARLIGSGILQGQHGGQKIASGTYWITMDERQTQALAEFHSGSVDLRARILSMFP